MSGITINRERLLADIEALAAYSDMPAPAMCRILFSETDVAARAKLKELSEIAGFSWREDAIGNLFIRLEGRDPALAPVATGSHTDAIPNSGKYDGVLGVLGGLEAMRAIQESGLRPQRALETIMFTAEEPTRFGVGCIGSRALAGAISGDELRALRDFQGLAFEEVRTTAGYKESLEGLTLTKGCYSHFVELHIEQGPHLEADSIDIGVVTGIPASTTMQITITGEGGHAGTVMMPERHDAMMAAAQFALQVEATARQSRSPDAVTTIGKFEVFPSASNSIPNQVVLTVDVRDRQSSVRDEMMTAIEKALHDICKQRGVSSDTVTFNCDPSAQSDEEILAAIEASAEELGLSRQRMLSRAFHDTAFMARLVPVAMIFIPCKNGYSHRPEEYSGPQEIENGVAVLANTMWDLANR